MSSRKSLVDQAIRFERPERIPIVFWNRDQTEGDVLLYHLSRGVPGDGNALANVWDWSTNEWGYRLESMDDGTMGHPVQAVWPELPRADEVRVPALREAERMAAVAEFTRMCEDRYRLASLDLSGFTVYTFLRGFENAMQDFLIAPERFGPLMDLIMDFECQLMTMAARHGFHGIHFADDWATQSGMIISPAMWRSLFKPRYQRQFDHAHRLGLDVWYHCCGNLTDIAEDFHQIGADVLNISQPNVVDLNADQPQAARPTVLHDADQLSDRFHSRNARGDPGRGPTDVPTAGDAQRRLHRIRRGIRLYGDVRRELPRLWPGVPTLEREYVAGLTTRCVACCELPRGRSDVSRAGRAMQRSAPPDNTYRASPSARSMAETRSS